MAPRARRGRREVLQRRGAVVELHHLREVLRPQRLDEAHGGVLRAASASRPWRPRCRSSAPARSAGPRAVNRRQVLPDAVLEHREVALREVGHVVAAGVGHRDGQVDDLDPDLEDGRAWRAGAAAAASAARQRRRASGAARQPARRRPRTLVLRASGAALQRTLGAGPRHLQLELALLQLGPRGVAQPVARRRGRARRLRSACSSAMEESTFSRSPAALRASVAST